MTPIRPYANDNGKLAAFIAIGLVGAIVWALAGVGAYSLAKKPVCFDDRVLLTMKSQTPVMDRWP